MKYLKFSSIAILGLFSFNSNTYAYAEISKIGIPSMSSSVQVVLDAPALNEQGAVQTMDQTNADAYCKNRGTRLPTVRELARHAQDLGAAGISSFRLNQEYYLINGVESGGQVSDSFYFNGNGFKISDSQVDNEGFWTWSSSQASSNSGSAYIWMPGLQIIYPHDHRDSTRIAVRCILLEQK